MLRDTRFPPSRDASVSSGILRRKKESRDNGAWHGIQILLFAQSQGYRREDGEEERALTAFYLLPRSSIFIDCSYFSFPGDPINNPIHQTHPCSVSSLYTPYTRDASSREHDGLPVRPSVLNVSFRNPIRRVSPESPNCAERNIQAETRYHGPGTNLAIHLPLYSFRPVITFSSKYLIGNEREIITILKSTINIHPAK